MNDTSSTKLFAYLTLLTGLCLSGVAIYYSVAGLAAIFAAAVIPIIIMGVVLEISKIVATLWLKQNWKTAPKTIRAYLIVAVGMLMLITSMGIFGFLSKAHSDQSLISGGVQDQIAVYDQKIAFLREQVQNEKDNIASARSSLSQLDAQVTARLDRGTSESGAERAVQIRRQQKVERAELQKDIQASQLQIQTLNAQLAAVNVERSPIANEVRKVEAEVGPIKYIANFFYGTTDPTILEKAVSWMIIALIMVFDPMAIILLLASQYSFQKLKEPKEEIVDKKEPIELWNTMIAAAEKEKVIEEETPASNIANVVEEINEKPNPIARPNPSIEQTSQLDKTISQEAYKEAAEKNIWDMVKRVRDGILPFYKVPDDLKSSVKEGLDASKDNTNNPT
jgi:hypothetical protein